MYLNNFTLIKFFNLEEAIISKDPEEDIIDTEIVETPKERFFRRVNDIYNKRTNELTRNLNMGIGATVGALLGNEIGDMIDTNIDMNSNDDTDVTNDYSNEYLATGLGALGGVGASMILKDPLSSFTKPAAAEAYKKFITEKFYNKHRARNFQK